MPHLETKVWHLLSFIFIVLYGLHIYATRTLKGNISKTSKRDVRLVSFIVIVEMKTLKEGLRCSISCGSWHVTCVNKCLIKSHFETRVNVYEEEFHDQSCQVIINPWSLGLTNLQSVLCVFLPSYIIFLYAPILFRLMRVLWLKGV